MHFPACAFFWMFGVSHKPSRQVPNSLRNPAARPDHEDFALFHDRHFGGRSCEASINCLVHKGRDIASANNLIFVKPMMGVMRKDRFSKENRAALKGHHENRNEAAREFFLGTRKTP